VQCFLLQRLRRKLQRLRERRRPGSRWTDYRRNNTYSDEADRLKARYVSDFLFRHRPQRVTDFGCNTGRFSRIAARSGARVLAIDTDHDCVDALYRSLSRDRADHRRIQPLWTSFDNPTPGIGLGNSERKAFLARHRADALLVLALVHHLQVTGRLPLGLLAKHFAGLTEEWLVVEYVDPADPMFRNLAAFREDLYRDLTEESFARALQQFFTLVDRCPLPGGSRVLYTFRKKRSGHH
jgi:SAM-dependent methyltransferase